MDTFCYSEITFKHSWDDFAEHESAIDFIDLPHQPFSTYNNHLSQIFHGTTICTVIQYNLQI